MDGTVDAAIVPDPSAEPFGYSIVAKSSAPTSLMLGFAQVPPVELLQPARTDEAIRYFVAIGFGVVFLMAASLFGSTIAASVVEEKQTRVVEILISAIRARTLLAGKVIGNTILAMGQILALAAIATVGLIVTGQNAVLSTLGAPIIWFAVFFLFGFILLAAMFAAAASMVSRQEDIGSTTTPLTMLVMLPYLLVVFFKVVAVGVPTDQVPHVLPESYGTVASVGDMLFREFLYPFEAISLLLLVAIVGGVVISRSHQKEVAANRAADYRKQVAELASSDYPRQSGTGETPPAAAGGHH
jgi:ABC-type Na+ efflux pump permease subunit